MFCHRQTQYKQSNCSRLPLLLHHCRNKDKEINFIYYVILDNINKSFWNVWWINPNFTYRNQNYRAVATAGRVIFCVVLKEIEEEWMHRRCILQYKATIVWNGCECSFWDMTTLVFLCCCLLFFAFSYRLCLNVPFSVIKTSLAEKIQKSNSHQANRFHRCCINCNEISYSTLLYNEGYFFSFLSIKLI